MNRKARAMNVCIDRGRKCLRFNAGASSVLSDWDELDVLEKDSIIAVRSVRRGMYHASQEQGRNRTILSNQALVEYICKKFGCDVGDSLPVWTGEEDGVLFFGKMLPNGESCCVDEGFRPLQTKYNRRAGGRVYIHDHWIEFNQEVREGLPKAMSAYRYGNAVALLADPDGPLEPECRRASEHEMLVSAPLANYLRILGGEEKGKGRGVCLCAVLIPNGILIAPTAEALETAVQNRRAKREPIDVDDVESRFLTINCKGMIYISSGARVALGNPQGLSIQRRGVLWIIRGDDDGALRICAGNYVNQIFSVDLTRQLIQHWPGSKKLYLISQNGGWVLWPEPVLPNVQHEKSLSHIWALPTMEELWEM